jgi:hypothetical protein
MGWAAAGSLDLAGFAEKVPDRRHAPRFQKPALWLELDGWRYKTRDWSLGGFRIGDCRKPPRPRDRVQGRIEGIGCIGSFTAEVVRINEDGSIAGRFLEITPAILMAMGTVAAA